MRIFELPLAEFSSDAYPETAFIRFWGSGQFRYAGKEDLFVLLIDESKEILSVFEYATPSNE